MLGLYSNLLVPINMKSWWQGYSDTALINFTSAGERLQNDNDWIATEAALWGEQWGGCRVWQQRPCSLTDLSLVLSKMYDSRWCKVLIKIDFRALLVLCPSVIELLSLCICAFIRILTDFHVSALLLLYFSLCDKQIVSASANDGRSIVIYFSNTISVHIVWLYVQKHPHI